MASRIRHRPKQDAIDCSNDDTWIGSLCGVRPHCVLMHESEARAIAGLCAQYGDRETGGDMFGGWTRGGQPHCQLIIRPGPNAVCGHGHFAQDVEFLGNVSKALAPTAGIQWLGGFHSHNARGMSGPSMGDVRAVRHLAHRNLHIQSCVEIIVTSAGSAPVEGVPVRGSCPGPNRGGCPALSSTHSSSPIPGAAFTRPHPFASSLARARSGELSSLTGFWIPAPSVRQLGRVASGEQPGHTGSRDRAAFPSILAFWKERPMPTETARLTQIIRDKRRADETTGRYCYDPMTKTIRSLSAAEAADPDGRRVVFGPSDLKFS